MPEDHLSVFALEPVEDGRELPPVADDVGGRPHEGQDELGEGHVAGETLDGGAQRAGQEVLLEGGDLGLLESRRVHRVAGIIEGGIKSVPDKCGELRSL